MKRNHITGFLILQAVQIAAAFLWVFFSPADNKVTLFLWFTKSSFIMLLLISVLLLLSLLALYWVRKPDLTDNIQRQMDKWFIEKHALVPVLIVLVTSIALLIPLVILILTTPLIESVYGQLAPQSFPILHTLINRFLPVLVLFFLSIIEIILALSYYYRRQLAQRSAWSMQVLTPTLLAILIVYATIAHWAILVLQLRVFVVNPVWYWAYDFKSFTMRDLFYSALVLIPLALGAWLTLHRKKVLLPLLILFIAGWWLQTGIGYLEGDGFQAFGARYFNTYHRTYPYFASQNQLSIAENIRSYEDNLAKSMFTSTKPPGLMTFYILTESIVNGNPTASVYSPEVRQARLTNFITFAFPIFAALAVFLIFAFGRRFISPGSFPVLPAFLYVLSPNVVMFSLFIDQALYPAVFLAGSWLTFCLLARRSLLPAFLLGMLLYLFAFFAFTMLPLFVLAAIYIGLLWWQNPQKYPLIRQIKTGLLFLSGVFSSYWLMRWFFQYDFFPRFAKTMQVNHQFDFYERIGITPTTLPEPFLLRLQQIFQALWWNNLEFATAVGVAVYLLFLIYGIRLIVQLARRQSTPSGIVLSSFFLAFLALNAAGSAQGEIARLWLFWVPMVVIFASLELYRWAQKRPYLFYALLLAQFVTFMLTYHFQELKM